MFLRFVLVFFFIAVADHSCYAKAEASAQQGTGPVPLVESLPRFDSTDADHLYIRLGDQGLGDAPQQGRPPHQSHQEPPQSQHGEARVDPMEVHFLSPHGT